MRFDKRNVKKTTVAALWFFAVTSGIAYAKYENPAIPCPPCVSVPQFKDFADHMVQSGNAGNHNTSVVAGANVAESDIIGTVRSASNAQLGYSIADSMIQNGQSLTGQAAQVIGETIKARQAEQVVYAAADNLAEAMTLAILNHYGNMTQKQIIAELIEEGKSYGYISPDFNVTAENSKSGFSLISKAFAQQSSSSQRDFIWAAPPGKGGPPTDCSQANDNYGASGAQPGQQSYQVDSFNAAIYNSKLQAFALVSDEPDCTAQNATVDCDSSMIRGRMHELSVNGPKMKAQIANAVGNCQAGGSQSADNTDHSSFFISSAYAQSSSGGGKVTAMKQALAQAQTQSKTAHAPLNEMKEAQAGNTPSARQNKYSKDTAACGSGDWHAGMAIGGNKNEVLQRANDCTKANAAYWDITAQD